MASSQFSSEGFDLDAISNEEINNNNKNNENIIYEIGGGVTSTPPPPSTTTTEDTTNNNNTTTTTETTETTTKSESYKAKGNEQFKIGNYDMAYDLYTNAIEACPGSTITGKDLLNMRNAFEESEREKSYKRHQQQQQQQQNRSSRMDKKKNNDDDNDDGKKDARKEEQDIKPSDDDDDDDGPKTFVPPSHPHGSKLSVYYCNRAACLLHMERYEEAKLDCDVSLMLNPTYVKAYLRRMTANEQLDKTDEALRDAQQALMIDPKNINAKKNVPRLQKLEEERLEKLKEETMGKLKELGNMFLGNFGLSTDNFKAEKDPNTGSYNISFNNNPSS